MPPQPEPNGKQNGLRLLDEARFLRSWIEKPLVTGAVSPSGRALARCMASYVDPNARGPVVELGPGTGSVTEALLKRGVRPERLIAVEFNAEFVPDLEARCPGVRIVCGDAYAVKQVLAEALGGPAIAFVSSLPLLTKPVETRVRLLEDCFELAGRSAPFIQFTYGLTPPIPREAARGVSVSPSPRIWWNLPPAQVWIYRRLA
jgi:phosphatidylethanolamine/phosphatidyl-N-methylethanolamine N-methyltransferase